MILLVLSLIGLALGAVKLARVPVAASVLTALCCAILFLYVAALARMLELGAIALLWLGVIIGAISLFAPTEGSLRDRVTGAFSNMRPRAIAAAVTGAAKPASAVGRSLWRSLFYVALATVAILFALRLSDNFVFVAWDEFSHWALASRLMVMDDALHTASSPIYFRTYPPATALIQYLFANTLGFSESAVLFAQVLLTVASVVAALRGVTQRPLLAGVAFVVAFVVAYAIGFSLYEVYVDLLLGAMFGAVLAAVVTADWENDPPYWIAPVLAVLVLTKHMGLIFSAVVVGVIAVLAFERVVRGWISSRAFSLAPSGVQIRVGAASLLAIVVAYASWRLYYTSMGAEEFMRVPVTANALFSFFFDTTDARGIATWEEFARRMLEKPIVEFDLTLLGMEFEAPALHVSLALVACSALAAAITERGRRSQIALSFLVIAIGAWCYLQLLLFFYRFSFIEYEGVRLASFERYYGSYLLAWAMAIIAALALALVRMPLLVRGGAALVAALVIWAAPRQLEQSVVQPDEMRPVAGVYDWAANYDMQSALRRQVRSLADVVRADGADRDTAIYYISQNETGYTAVMFRYEIVPMRANRECWSLGARYASGDIWTCDISLAESLQGYDYLVLRNADPNFWTRFGYMFEPGERGVRRGVYAIDETPSGLHLRRLPYDDCGDVC